MNQGQRLRLSDLYLDPAARGARALPATGQNPSPLGAHSNETSLVVVLIIDILRAVPLHVINRALCPLKHCPLLHNSGGIALQGLQYQ